MGSEMCIRDRSNLTVEAEAADEAEEVDGAEAHEAEAPCESDIGSAISVVTAAV